MRSRRLKYKGHLYVQAASYSSDTLFLASSIHTPKGWCYDHVGFVDKATRNLIQMSGHRHEEGVFLMSKLTDDPVLKTDHYDTIKLPKTVTFTDASLGAVNCVTFVIAVLKENGIHDWDREDLHKVFKCGDKKPLRQALSSTGYESVSFHSEQEMKTLRPSPLYGVISITDPGRQQRMKDAQYRARERKTRKLVKYKGHLYVHQVSAATHTVEWVKPNLQEEVKEYFETPFIQEVLGQYGYTFKTAQFVHDFLQDGSLVNVTREALQGGTDTEHLDEAFDKYLEDPEYASSFLGMESSLKQGDLTLPAPIFIQFSDGTFLGFSGQRRTNLAWRHNLPLKVWLIKAAARSTANVEALVSSGYDSVSYHSEKEMQGLRPSPLYGVISITDPGRTANLPEGWGSVLRLQFDDVEEPEPYKPYGDSYAKSYHLPTASDAQKILSWLKANEGKLAGVYVHCWGGVSRSAAVAKFIAEKYGIPFDHTYDNYNTLVYELLRQEDKGVV